MNSRSEYRRMLAHQLRGLRRIKAKVAAASLLRRALSFGRINSLEFFYLHLWVTNDFSKLDCVPISLANSGRWRKKK